MERSRVTDNNTLIYRQNQSFLNESSKNNNSFTTSNTLLLDRLDLVLLVFYILVFVVGITGNSLVCIYFKFSNKKMKIMEYMILWLALSDLLASILNPTLYAYWQLTFRRTWHFGYIGCKVIPVIGKSSTSISLGIIMLINIDRCIVITRPFRPKMRKRDVNIAVFGIVLLSIAGEIPFIVYAEVMSGYTCVVPNTFIPGFAYPTLAVHIVRDLLFLIVFLSTVITIYNAISHQDIRSLHDQKRMERNKAVLVMLATIAVVFILLVFPREILHVTYIITWLDNSGIPYTDTLRDINAAFKILHMCNSICNVFIYAGLHRRFRRDVSRKVVQNTKEVTRKVSNTFFSRSNGFRNNTTLDSEHSLYTTKSHCNYNKQLTSSSLDESSSSSML